MRFPVWRSIVQNVQTWRDPWLLLMRKRLRNAQGSIIHSVTDIALYHTKDMCHVLGIGSKHNTLMPDFIIADWWGS